MIIIKIDNLLNSRINNSNMPKKQVLFPSATTHQWDFKNPGEMKNMVLNKDRQWVEAIVVNYQKDNKEVVKKIQADCKCYKQELEEIQK